MKRGILSRLLSHGAYFILMELYLDKGHIVWEDREHTRPLWYDHNARAVMLWNYLTPVVLEKLERDGWLTDKLLLTQAGHQLLMGEWGDVDKLVAALQVCRLDARHHAWMVYNDPMCLEQIEHALRANGVEVA